jgi:hypothetical protein
LTLQSFVDAAPTLDDAKKNGAPGTDVTVKGVRASLFSFMIARVCAHDGRKKRQ